MSDNGESAHDVPVTKKVRGRKWDSLMMKREQVLEKRILRTQQGPNKRSYEEQVRELVKRGEAISAEHLGHLGKALLEQDLVNPPKDHRARVQVARAALECDGVIGPRSVELHLHEMATLPPVVRLMMESKMRELSGLPELPTVIEGAPPDPIAGEDKNHG
jgi:hypothetical protein